MRRVLVFAGEVGAVVAGMAVGATLFALSAAFENIVLLYAAAIVFWILPSIAVWTVRRRNHCWKIEYDAVGWELGRAERRLHPDRVRLRRCVGWILLCVPSGIAAFVLFFSPVATHLLQPRSRFFEHHRIPIPWTYAVIGVPGPINSSYFFAFGSDKGVARFGVTRFTNLEQLSYMTFFAQIPFDESSPRTASAIPRGTTLVLSREFQLGEVALHCRQFFDQSEHRWAGTGPVVVSCDTPSRQGQKNLHVSFHGHEHDLATFYKVLEGVTLAN